MNVNSGRIGRFPQAKYTYFDPDCQYAMEPESIKFGNVDVLATKELFRRCEIPTTMVYAKSDIGILQKAADKLNELE